MNSITRIDTDSFIFHYESERPVDWAKCFGRFAPLDLEIGFGLGDFLIRKAQQEPLRDFVGLEMEWPRVKKALTKMADLRRNPTLNYPANVRFLQVDVTVALERLFRPETISRVYCLFPCPWPKKSHSKHRLFSRPFTRLVNSRMMAGGQVQLVTDFQPYFDWLQEEVQGAGFDLDTDVIKPQFGTKYERKWCAGGQKEFFELRLSKRVHQDIPLKEDEALRTYFVENFNPDRFQLSDVKGEITVVQKEFIFDTRREKGLIHVIVAEPSLTQHLWVVIVKAKQGWCVAKAEGQTVVPTVGVAMAIQKIADAAAESIR